MALQPVYFIPIVFFALLFASVGSQWQALIMVLVMPYVYTPIDLAFLLFFSLAFATFGHWLNAGSGRS